MLAGHRPVSGTTAITNTPGAPRMHADSIEAALLLAGLLWAGWILLLYRLHRLLDRVDPELSRQIGRPSLFWTAFNGHAALIRLISQRDLDRGRHAPLDGLVRILRLWALAVMAATLWLLWVAVHTPGL